ncbi:agmatine deiminase family protein [Microbaculum marinum]|uniref:Putative agmatine deiminase n=1 Tax=Microbaculum marinum TaxID=1764581 RepID=A0AAW9RY35_9HYPH
MSDTPSGQAYRMPAEWTRHRRTWMAWPCNPTLLEGIGPQKAFAAWASVANAIADFEPVVMVVPPGRTEEARRYLSAAVETVEQPLGDSWMRDFGPTFVIADDGTLAGVDWTFNGWGGRTFPEASADAEVAAFVCRQAGAERLPSKLVNEGGGIHVDGEGTLLLTESVQLNRNRNPSWTREEIEAELHRRLGTETAIWLPRGLVADTSAFGTDGHIDTLACFVRPGVVVAHGQPDPGHPDHETSRENIEILKGSTDAKGRRLEVIVLDAPAERYLDGEPLSCSYVNFSFVNGGVVLCGFDDPKDAETVAIFERLFPDRRIVQVPATPIFEGGGGIHCITQQEPAVEAP